MFNSAHKNFQHLKSKSYGYLFFPLFFLFSFQFCGLFSFLSRKINEIYITIHISSSSCTYFTFQNLNELNLTLTCFFFLKVKFSKSHRAMWNLPGITHSYQLKKTRNFFRKAEVSLWSVGYWLSQQNTSFTISAEEAKQLPGSSSVVTCWNWAHVFWSEWGSEYPDKIDLADHNMMMSIPRT